MYPYPADAAVAESITENNDKLPPSCHTSGNSLPPCNIPHHQRPAFCRFIDVRTPKFSGDAARAASITRNRLKRVLTSHSPYLSFVRSNPRAHGTRVSIIYYTWKPIYIYKMYWFFVVLHTWPRPTDSTFFLLFGDEIKMNLCAFTVFNSSCAVIII